MMEARAATEAASAYLSKAGIGHIEMGHPSMIGGRWMLPVRTADHPACTVYVDDTTGRISHCANLERQMKRISV